MSQTAVDDINALIPVIALDVDPAVSRKNDFDFPIVSVWKLRSLV